MLVYYKRIYRSMHEKYLQIIKLPSFSLIALNMMEEKNKTNVSLHVYRENLSNEQ